MRKILIPLVLMVLPSVLAAQFPEVVPVPRSDCASWTAIPGGGSPFPLPGFVPTYLAAVANPQQFQPQGPPACQPAAASIYGAVSADVYTRKAVDTHFVTNEALSGRLDELTKNLQTALDNSVVEAAIQDDQVTLISDEVWRRLHLKLAADLDALTKASQTLKAEIETMRKTLDAMRAAAAKAGH